MILVSLCCRLWTVSSWISGWKHDYVVKVFRVFRFFTPPFRFFTPPCHSLQAQVPAAPWTARCLRTGMCGNQNHVRSAFATAARWCVMTFTVRNQPTAPTPSLPRASAAPPAPTTVKSHLPFSQSEQVVASFVRILQRSEDQMQSYKI